MTKSFEDPPPPFRSLGADNSKSQANAQTAARAAQDRWPLFKTLAPASPAPVPPMEMADKRHWERAGGADQRVPRRTLSVPDLAEAMARGLGRMGMPGQGNAGRQPGQDAPERSGMPALMAAQSAAQSAAPSARPDPAERTHLPAQRAQPEEKRDARPATAAPKGMFAHFAPPAQVDTDEDAGLSPPPQADRSLSAIFARLKHQQTPPGPIPATPPSRAAFLSRLGRK